jgi:competence protein ComEA
MPDEPGPTNGKPETVGETSPHGSSIRAGISNWFLRRTDQTVIAAVVVLCLTAIGVWYLAQGGWSWAVIDADRAETQSVRYQVDVNTAEVPELIQIPGIGETLAGRIIESREKDGPYGNIDELIRVKGIGKKVLERIRPYLMVKVK